jgi:NAD(P)-dependent dehydrogenase (short-subunit alcohol dehydrogenase family)
MSPRKETALHGLINNAGIMGVPFAMTSDGYESQFQTNYLSHWLLTHHLLPLLNSTAASSTPGGVRIVNVTSDGHMRFPPKGGINLDDINLESEGSMVRYGQSKLANILHAKELHRSFGPKDGEQGSAEIWVAAVHPGHIDT